MPAQLQLFSVTHWLLNAATLLCIFVVAILTLALMAIVVGLGAFLAAPAALAATLTSWNIPAVDGIPLGAVLGALLFAVAGGLISMICVLLAVRATTQIVETAISGDPFVSDNAVRLKRIGWLLLGIMLVQFLTMMVVDWIAPHNNPGVNINGGSEPDPVGLLAVLLIFVLARIFHHGSEMRDELEATV